MVQRNHSMKKASYLKKICLKEHIHVDLHDFSDVMSFASLMHSNFLFYLFQIKGSYFPSGILLFYVQSGQYQVQKYFLELLIHCTGNMVTAQANLLKEPAPGPRPDRICQLIQGSYLVKMWGQWQFFSVIFEPWCPALHKIQGRAVESCTHVNM